MHVATILFSEFQVRLLFKGGYHLGCGFYSNKINMIVGLPYFHKKRWKTWEGQGQGMRMIYSRNCVSTIFSYVWPKTSRINFHTFYFTRQSSQTMASTYKYAICFKKANNLPLWAFNLFMIEDATDDDRAIGSTTKKFSKILLQSDK